MPPYVKNFSDAINPLLSSVISSLMNILIAWKDFVALSIFFFLPGMDFLIMSASSRVDVIGVIPLNFTMFRAILLEKTSSPKL